MGKSEGISITLTRSGLRTGSAYVQVSGLDDIDTARQLHRQHLADRYIQGEWVVV